MRLFSNIRSIVLDAIAFARNLCLSRSALAGLRSFALYEGDVLTIAPDSRIEYSRGSEEPPDLLEFEEAHFSPTANTRHHFPAIGDLSCLDELAHRAASHMFAKMNRLGLSSEWVLALTVSDGGWEPWYVDLARRECTRKRPADRPMLTCRSESNYLVALLTGNAHWNNAMISFNLRWHRLPDVYDRPRHRNTLSDGARPSGACAVCCW